MIFLIFLKNKGYDSKIDVFRLGHWVHNSKALALDTPRFFTMLCKTARPVFPAATLEHLSTKKTQMACLSQRILIIINL